MMSSELSEKDILEIKQIFGDALSENFFKAIQSFKEESQAREVLQETRYNTLLAKLNTVISMLDKEAQK